MKILELQKPINAYKHNANIYIDGKRAPINDFIEYKGKVYVPVDEISMITKKIFYDDSANKNFFFGKLPVMGSYINDICCPTSKINCELRTKFKYNNTFYKNAMIFSNLYAEKPNFAEINYRLNGLFTKFSFELLKLSDNNEDNTIFWVMEKDFSIDTFELKEIESGQRIELNIRGRDYMRLYFLNTQSNFEYAIVNACLE